MPAVFKKLYCQMTFILEMKFKGSMKKNKICFRRIKTHTNKIGVWVVILLVFCNLFSAAQNTNIDSLHKLLKVQKQDTNRIRTLNELGWEFLNRSEYSQAMNYLTSALTLSQKLNYKRGAALAHDIIGLVYYDK